MEMNKKKIICTSLELRPIIPYWTTKLAPSGFSKMGFDYDEKKLKQSIPTSPFMQGTLCTSLLYC